jgi:hypothetical protein
LQFIIWDYAVQSQYVTCSFKEGNMIVLLESSDRILGLGVGLFAIVVVVLVGLVASMLAWAFNKEM